MPKGPRGEKRPADAVGLAVMVAKLAAIERLGAERKASEGDAPPG